MISTSLSLIDRLKEPLQNANAWDRFVRLYTPLLCYWCMKMGLREEEVQDVVQEVLVLLLHKIREFVHDGRTFRGWLRTILKNKCRDYLRKQSRTPQPIGLIGFEFDAQLEVADDVALLTDAEYRSFIARQALRLIQTEFEESTWRACWLTLINGLSAQAAAEQLQISVNAVFVARSRVLGRLRDEFSGLLED